MQTTQLLSRVYSALLGLYPQAVRSDYADEMAAVFGEMLSEAQQTSAWRTWQVFLHELAEFPIHMILAYLDRARVGTWIEKILENPKRTRWQQAGGLGFAVGAGLLELLNGLLQLGSLDPGRYTTWNAWIQVSVDNSSPHQYTTAPFHALALPLLAIVGLVVGLIMAHGEIPPKPLRFAIGIGASLPAAYVALYGISLLVKVLPTVTGLIASFYNLLLVLGLIGAVVALLMGLFTQGWRGKHAVNMAGAGLCGYLVGALAYALAYLALSLILSAIWMVIWRISGSPDVTYVGFSPDFWGRWGLAIVCNSAAGWAFGEWVGREMGSEVAGSSQVVRSQN